MRDPRTDRCRACGAEIEWVRDGGRMVPVDAGSRIAVVPGRGPYACYPPSGGVVVGRLVSRTAEHGGPRVRWGRSLHWATCAGTGCYEKAREIMPSATPSLPLR